MIVDESKNKRWKKALCGAAALALVLNGCSLSNAKPTSVQVETEREVTQPETRKPNDAAVDSVVLGENNGIVITTPAKKGSKMQREITVDLRGDVQKTFVWNADMDANRPPTIEEVDVNGDGEREIVVNMNAGRGTGISIYEIHILNSNTLEELAVEDPIQALNKRVISSVKHESGKTFVHAELNGQHLSKVYDYEEGAWGKRVGFGSIVYYEVVDGRLRAKLDGQASISEFPLQVVVDYGHDLHIANVELHSAYFMETPLNEEDINVLLQHWLPNDEWEVKQTDDQYTVTFVKKDQDAEAMVMKVNPMTGTVHDSTSGSPLKSLVNKDAPDLAKITNGTRYQAELYKLAGPLLEAADLQPVNREWIEGFIGDGYLFGRVKHNDRQFIIKLDVFTGQWEEIKDPFGESP
ncbi:hypothetical protein MKY59_13860 [Paenibacillus sp. FSL W8-0426]|uniref:hypothetical protein n=1 Tax=Paenibacillus sp. FSL W8-0426 TaxID=2921714 RepID=UPI0030DD915A